MSIVRLSGACGKSLTAGRLIAMFYFAALMEITVLRGGVHWGALLRADRVPIRLRPFRTTIAEFHRGAWPFVYHVVGNLAWFVPVGIILRRKPVWMALVYGALLSALIEALQWALMTGMTDEDDVILNSCGALAGWLIARAFARLWAGRCKTG